MDQNSWISKIRGKSQKFLIFETVVSPLMFILVSLAVFSKCVCSDESIYKYIKHIYMYLFKCVYIQIDVCKANVCIQLHIIVLFRLFLLLFLFKCMKMKTTRIIIYLNEFSANLSVNSILVFLWFLFVSFHLDMILIWTKKKYVTCLSKCLYLSIIYV